MEEQEQRIQYMICPVMKRDVNPCALGNDGAEQTGGKREVQCLWLAWTLEESVSGESRL